MTYIGIGKTYDDARGDNTIADSVVVELRHDFQPPTADGESDYLVIPDLAKGLYYSDGFRDRDKYADLLPGPAWKLTSCSGPGQGSSP
jgi:hypothetical protein